MHLISFDASPRQLSKIRNGHSVRIKKGSGFNLVVHPNNYNLVSRAFSKNKGIQLKLSPEEIEANQNLSPEQHDELGQDVDDNLFEHLPYAEGGSIFKSIHKRIKNAFKSKTGKKIFDALEPLKQHLKRVGKDYAQGKLDELHSRGREKYGDNEIASKLMDIARGEARKGVEGLGMHRHHGFDVNGGALSLKSIGRTLKKTFEPVAKAMKPVSRAVQSTGHNLMKKYSQPMQLPMGMGLGCGLGTGMNAHDALRLANMATASANHQMAKMHNATVHGQLTLPPIRRHWDDPYAPPSRGTGITNHYNMIRGRGSMLSQDDILPPALQSQPYGANFHMQFFLPPQYHRYNDGTDIEGRGLYI